MSASVEVRPDDGSTYTGSLGASVYGELDLGPQVHDLHPGAIAVFSTSRSLEDTAPWFVVVGWSFGVSWAPTEARDAGRGEAERGHLVTGDVRWNLTAGRLLFDALAPYAALRLFGGPILWWRGDSPIAFGTDRYHVQAALGLLVPAATGVDAFVELAPVGERAVTVGVGYAL